MNRIFPCRPYCTPVAKTVEKVVKEKLDFTKLFHVSKIPEKPVNEDFNLCCQKEVEIDKGTVQLLERLSLVNLDGEQALKTLKSSIQFAKRIEGIDVEGKKPLYTTLDNESIYLRDDIVDEGDCREEILRNAKVIEEDYFISPPGNIPLKQEE